LNDISEDHIELSDRHACPTNINIYFILLVRVFLECPLRGG